jgi:hypothetical protein
MIRKTISHFRVLKKFGGGGMGVVYRPHEERGYPISRIVHARRRDSGIC